MIETILSHLGFNEDEIKTYLYLLETGPSTVGQLAKQLPIPRPSLYGFLARLHAKGLILESKNLQGVKVFVAESPEKLTMLFQQQIENLKKHEESYRTILPELLQKKAFSSVIPDFQLFKGREGLQQVLKDALLYPNTETYSYWAIKDAMEAISPDFFRYINKERIRANISIKSIWPASKMVDLADHPYLANGEKMKRELRIAPKEIDFSMGYWIYGNKVAFLSSQKESFGFIIESAELVEMMKSQWNLIWNLSKPVAADPKTTEPFLFELEQYK